MSQTIDNRIVEMQFDNKQFESGVSESLSTLDKLKQALKFDDASKNLQDFGKNVNKNIDLSGISKSIEGLSDKFSASGIAGMEAIRKLTDFAIEAGKTMVSALDAPFKQIREGGWKRAMNIEDAKFQLKGLDIAWESVSDDINYAVADTAYGLDEAAKACSQLSASSVRAGSDMKAALRGISGVAAMGNTEYTNIANIFTKAAGNGKVMADELNRISQYGLNARASMASFFNDIIEGGEKTKDIPEEVKQRVKSITKGVKVTEAQISEFASKSKLDFQTFSYAMDSAFGEHAKKANETFFGALSNIKAALSKIGAEFATPIIKGAIPVFNQIRIFLNDLRKQMSPLFEVFAKIADIVSNTLTDRIKRFAFAFNDLGGAVHIGNALKNVFTSIVKIITAVGNAFNTVFKPVTGFETKIMNVTEAIEKFSEHLVISDEAALVFRNIMVVVFNILKAIGTAIKAILPIVGKVATVALNIINIIIKVIAVITTLISKLGIVQAAMSAIEQAGGLFAFVVEKIKDAFYYLRDILTDTSTVTGQVFAKIKDAAMIVVYIVGGTLYLAFMKIKEILSYFDTHDPLGSIVKGVKSLVEHLKQLPVIRTLVAGVELAFGAIGLVISKIIGLIKDFITNIKSGMSVAKAFGTTLATIFGGVVTTFAKLIDKVKSGFSDLFGAFKKDRVIEESIEIPMTNAEGAIVGVEKTLTKTGESVKNLSTALERGQGSLSDYQYQVSNTKSAFEKAKDTVVAFGKAVLDKIRNINAGAVILFAFSLTVISLTANLSKLVKAATGVTNSIKGILDAIAGKRKSTFLQNVLAITAGIATLAASLYALAQLDTAKLVGVTVCLGSLITVLGLFSTFAKEGSNAFALSMVSFSGSILIMVAALKVLDSIKVVDVKDIWIKVGILGAIAGGMVVVTALLSKFAPSFSRGGLAVVAFAGSIYILAQALKVISESDLNNIKNNWKELTYVLVAMSALAALASRVGVAAGIGLLAFIGILKLLSTNATLVKSTFTSLQGAFQSLGDTIKNILRYFYDALKQVAKDIEQCKMLGEIISYGIKAIIVTVIGSILALGIAGKGIKRAAVGFTLIAASIAGLMYVTMKIAELSQSIDPGSITMATKLLNSLLAFVEILAAIAALPSELKFGDKFSLKSNEGMIKDMRKLISSIAILLLAVGGFAAMVGSLNESQFQQVNSLLIETEVIVGIIAGLCAIITAVVAKNGKAEVSFSTFIGITLLVGTLVGAIAVLMFMFSQVDFKRDWQMLTAVGVSFVAISALILLILHSIEKIEKAKAAKNAEKSKGQITKTLAAVGLIVAAVGGFVVLLHREFQNDGGWSEAAKYAGVLVGALAAISLMIVALEGFSNKFQNTELRQKGFTNTINALWAMIAALAVFALGIVGLQNVDAGRMWGQITALTFGLTAITALVLAIQYFSKQTKFSITKKSQSNIIKTFAMIAAFLVAFKVLVKGFKTLEGVDAGRMWGQTTALIFTLTTLVALAEAMIFLVKKLSTGWSDIAKAGTILAGMVGIFTILSVVFRYLVSGIDPEGLYGKIHAITLVMLELEALAVGCLALGKYAADIGKGELVLLGMVALFGALTLIFTLIDGMNPDKLLAKSQSIILVMLELEVLAAICGALGLIAPNIGLGELTLLGMVALFGALTLIFTLIDGMNPEKLLAKSQSIILVMLELEVLAAICGALGMFAPVIALGELTLLGMVVLFGALTLVFTLIDGMKPEKLLAKSQSIILVMLELEVLAAICGVLGGFAPVIGLGELALLGMVALFGALALVFTVIDDLNPDKLLAKSQSIVLVLLELEGLLAVLGVLSPLAAAAMVGIPGLLGVVLALVGIAGAVKLIGDMDLSQIQGTIDIFIEALQKLMGIGLEGIAAGPGLILVASGIGAIALACGAAGLALGVFASAVASLAEAIKALTATGPSILSWFNNIGLGISSATMAISSSVLMMSTTIVMAVNTLITGIAQAIKNGKTILFGESAGLGDSIIKGLKSKLSEIAKIPADIVKALISGLKSIAGSLVNAGKSMGMSIVNGFRDALGWHSPPGLITNFMADAKNAVLTYGGEVGQALFGEATDWGNQAKAALGNIDLSGMLDVSNLMGGKEGLMGDINDVLRAIGLLKSEMASLHSAGHGTRDDFMYQLQQEEKQLVKNQNRLQNVAKIESNYGKVTQMTTNEVKNNNKALEENRKKQKELTEGVKEAVPAVQDLGTSLGGLGDSAKKGAKSTKEAKDEIAEFYDSIKGAISLFEEFNKETELTSDQLISNMRSQIEGISEWSSQIQKLAFMGIDQGLLKELADMGPQGYQYTNAFVHMTAEQLAEANNLYHQSLMLPSKVTSQVYGSYTIAGRSAASGFLQGMSQEDIKGAAVNFAHDVVDQMNLALDIQSGVSQVTYEDGVAVVNGVKTGMNAPYVKQNLETAIGLLTDNNIKGKFESGLFNNSQMYNIGANITKGIAKGVEDDGAVNDLVGAVVRVANKAENAFTKKEKIESPSKVFAQFGKYIVLGLANGLTENTQAAVDAMDTTADTIINTMRDTINKANQALIDDIDEPVITPVLDLSEIQNGSRQLDNMLSRNSAFSAGSSFTDLQNGQWNSQNALLNATMDNTDVVSAIGSLSEDIAMLKDAMTNIKMVMDTGAVVGALTPGIDQELGMRQVYAGRGI